MTGLNEYCQQTSLHGWNYIANDKREWKVVWAFVVAASIGHFRIYLVNQKLNMI